MMYNIILKKLIVLFFIMYKKTTFPNGLRLITVPMSGTNSVTVFVLFGVGSRYETADINGASHFIEHLMFKGTKKRPTTLDISKALDSVGAEYNAATSKDWTGYYVKIDSRKIELAMDVVSDMLYNSKFDKKEIDRERGVIVEEINMYHDNPLMYVEDLLEQLMYRDTTLGWEIAGPKQVIREVSCEKLIAYRDAYYQPKNMVIGVAGKINHQIINLVKKYFQTTQKNDSPGRAFDAFINKQTKPQIIVNYKDTEQVQLALGFHAYSHTDPRLYAQYLLGIILGGNMSSRLFISVRERRGLAYFVRVYPNIYQDTGNLIIQSGLDKSRLELAIKTILAELKKIKRSGVTADELKKAKEYLRGKLVLSLEDTEDMVDWYIKQELLFGQTLTPEEKLKKFEAVTLAQVKQVAKEIFTENNLNLAIIGPYKNDKNFKPLLKV